MRRNYPLTNALILAASKGFALGDVIVIAAALTVIGAGCGPSETPHSGAQAGASVTPAAAKTPAAKPVAAKPVAAKPAAIKTPVTKPAPAKATGMKNLSADEMKELERRPGATAASKSVTVPPGPKAADLAGAPGPSPAMGPNDALVKVYVFSDFQCPVCKRAVEPSKQLLRDFPGQVQVIFKHNALTTHNRAEAAAIASLAAFRQGKFWELHDLLFQNQRALQDSDFAAYAAQIGLDPKRFSADLLDAKLKAQVDYERDMAQRLGARGTPGFFVNGKRTVGWGSYAGLKAQVSRALKAAQAAVEGGALKESAAADMTRAGDALAKQLADLMYGAAK